jgi:anti-sigma-K factor RskA
MSGHEFWEEQAAGYALDALEPDERAEFERHLAGCAECRELVDQHALVAAQLGALAYDDRPAPTWPEIRDRVVEPMAEPRGNVARIRHRRAAVMLSAAAAAVAAVVGITVWQSSGGSNNGPLTSANACTRTAGCHVVVLSAPGTRGTTALSVLVYGHDVALLPAALGRAPAGSEWALWRLPRSGGPQLMTTFDQVKGTRGSVAAPYADIAGFAVSREAAGSTPAKPSTVVAYGTAA